MLDNCLDKPFKMITTTNHKDQLCFKKKVQRVCNERDMNMLQVDAMVVTDTFVSFSNAYELFRACMIEENKIVSTTAGKVCFLCS